MASDYLSSPAAPATAGARRLALVLPRVPQRRELAPGPLDEPWVVEQIARGVDLHLFVDEASPASESLRRAGVPVWLSPRRPQRGGDGRERTADEVRAEAVAHRHAERPFAAVLVDSGAGLPPNLVAPGLTEIPWGLVLGSGPIRDLEVVWDDPRLFAELGREVQASGGILACADFLVSAVAPAPLGLRTELPVVRPGDEIRLGPGGTPPADGPTALVATREPGRDLAGIVDRVVRDVAGPLVVVVSGSGAGGEARRRLAGDRWGSREGGLLVVETGADGIAAEWLETASRIVLASARELAIPAVADLAGRCCLFAGREVEFRVPTSLADHLDLVPPRGARGRAAVHPWNGGQEVARLLEALDREDGGVAGLLLCTERTGERAFAAAAGAAPGADVVVWGRPQPPFGHPSPHWVDADALLLGRSLWRAAARVAREAGDLRVVLRWAMSGRALARTSVLVLPGDAAARYVAVDERADFPDVAHPRGSSPLPAPRFLPGAAPYVPEVPPAPAPAKGRGAPAGRITLEQFARRSPWWRRLQLALPWRFGMLEKAMGRSW